jgi:predicted RNA-binding protein YlxR (DUF448 family)
VLAAADTSDGVMVEPEGSVRRCVATRMAGDARHMLRFVLAPDGTLVPDLAGRLPGRGMWVDADREVLARAVARGGFARAARAKVTAPAGLVDEVGAMLARRCLDRVGLARRAGELVAGFDQCADWLRSGRAALVLTASDGGGEGRRRLEALAGPEVPVLDPFARAELGPAIGREEIVHVALGQGGHARWLLVELERLRGFRRFGVPEGHAANGNASLGGASRT